MTRKLRALWRRLLRRPPTPFDTPGSVAIGSTGRWRTVPVAVAEVTNLFEEPR
jgi:hypothetical protein